MLVEPPLQLTGRAENEEFSLAFTGLQPCNMSFLSLRVTKDNKVDKAPAELFRTTRSHIWPIATTKFQASGSSSPKQEPKRKLQIDNELSSGQANVPGPAVVAVHDPLLSAYQLRHG